MNSPVIFHHPFSMIVAGPTMCGKSHFIINLLNSSKLIKPKPSQVFWHYGIENREQFNEIQTASLYPVTFIKGLPIIEELQENKNSIIILDDLMQDSGKSKGIADLFTKGVHHCNISVILLMQNIFHQGKHMRDISLNTSYFVLFKNPRDSRQILTLSSQIFGKNSNYLIDAYQQATKRPHGYLIINLTQHVPDNQRLYTNIFPLEFYYLFVPKK